MMKTALLAALAATVFILASAQTTTQPLMPATPVPQLSTFGLIGLAPNQTARLNALGMPMGGPIIANVSCQVTLTFVDDQGNSLKTATQTVISGKSTPLDLSFSEIMTATTSRAEIRGTVQTGFVVNNQGTGGPLPAPVVGTGSCSVLPTLEIFDQANGRTTVLLNTPQALPAILPL